MAERENLTKLSTPALRNRRHRRAKLVPPLAEILRGSLMKRYLTCGNPNCKCARGERHGPVWYLSGTLDQSQRKGSAVRSDPVAQVRRWTENYHRVREHLEKIYDINRELLRRDKNRRKGARQLAGGLPHPIWISLRRASSWPSFTALSFVFPASSSWTASWPTHTSSTGSAPGAPSATTPYSIV